MKIISFSISNYRSILKAHKLIFKEKIVLIGPNNEGKSNILHGLVLSLTTLCFGITRAKRMYMGRRKYMDREYFWERDFPIQLQDKKTNGMSDFKIEFELTKLEKNKFTNITQINLNSNLIINLKYSQKDISFSIIIPGRAKQKLEDMYDDISTFIRNNLHFQYIPAVRTTRYTLDIVERMIEEELGLLDKDSKYNDLLNQIKKLQKPILKALSTNLKKSIKEFVPDLIDIKIDTEDTLRRAIRRSSNVIIDDGIATDLEQKGDGIKSLVAISLAKHIKSYNSEGKSLIIALEEPESHLHPGAIHRLSNVLTELSIKQQVFVTTHSPLLIDRHNISNNILVNKNNAKPAKNIEEIRNIIGVQVSDNLTNSSWVLLVEGETDKIILQKWFGEYSTEITTYLTSGKLSIDTLNGGTNLSYKISQYRNMLCNSIVFLDNDDCGRQSYDKAKSQALCDLSDVVFSVVPSKKQSEIEDLIISKIYFDGIMNRFGVNLNINKFTSIKRKWSEKLGQIFRENGKPWDDEIEKEVKSFVANAVQKSDDPTLIPELNKPIINLINLIKNKI